MSDLPTLQTSRAGHRPKTWCRLTKVFGVLGTAGALIVSGLLSVSQVGFSQETKTSDAKKPDLSKRGAVGVFLYESEDHVLVSKVVPKSPAEKAGLQVGDDIRYVDKERIKSAQGLIDEIASVHPGTQVDVIIRRGGERQTLKLQVVSHEDLFPNTPPAKPMATATVPVATPSSPISPEAARRLRVLEMQLARMQAEMDQLKSKPYVPKPAPPAQNFDVNNWLEQHRLGDNDGDPSLFQ
jgi:membrane-associated protease RseP (regulator of RpoE activity)